MTEILLDVDFGHPPERVWRALTDRTLLSEWFMRTDLEPYEGRRFRLQPDGLLGLAGPLEGELVEVAAPRRLVMLWRGEQMHSRVTWELVPLPEGCRLRMSHTGFIGVKGTLRRKELQRAYHQMLHDRLPRVLGELAAGKGGLLKGAAAPPLPAAEPAEAPAPEPREEDVDGDRDADRPRRAGVFGWLTALPHRRRGQIAAVAGATLLALLTAAVISGLGVPEYIPPLGAAPDDPPLATPAARQPPAGTPPPVGPGATGEPAAPPTAGPGADAVAPGAPGSSGPGVVVPPEPTPPPPGASRWRAAYRTVSTSTSGFAGAITVTNTTAAPATGWLVTITLPDGARLGTVKKTSGTQSGNTVSFTAKNAGKVGPGASITLEFQVDGAGATGPTACRIEGADCAGLSG